MSPGIAFLAVIFFTQSSFPDEFSPDSITSIMRIVTNYRLKGGIQKLGDGFTSHWDWDDGAFLLAGEEMCKYVTATVGNRFKEANLDKMKKLVSGSVKRILYVGDRIANVPDHYNNFEIYDICGRLIARCIASGPTMMRRMPSLNKILSSGVVLIKAR
jgi:hypothetical protein